MKTQIKIAVVALGILLTAHAKAQDFQPSENVETPTYLAKFHISQETSRMWVYVVKQKENKNTLFLGITDASNHVVYCRKFGKKEKQAVVLLNFDEINDGTYILELSDRNGKTFKTFYKESGNVLVSTKTKIIALN